MIFADASALIAIIVGEPEAEELADAMEADPDRICSAVSVWETIAGLCRSYAFRPESARDCVSRFRLAGQIVFVGLAEPELEIAAEAYARYGKGRHPAALNMGDCFAYACTKTNHARLLFKGDDFGRTDIEKAI